MPLSPGRFRSRYNVAPGASLTVVVHPGQNGLADMGWGIVPAWARPGRFSRPLINARAETVWEKPSFRHLIRSCRAIIPVNGFYEWQRTRGGKLPYYFHPAQGQAVGLAGIFQTQEDGTAQVCVITTGANDVMRPVHDRMPVILAEDDMAAWLLDSDRSRLDSLMQPATSGAIEAVPVSEFVSNARNEGPACIEPVPGDSRNFTPES